MKRLTQWGAVLVFAWLAACTSLSFDQRLAAGYELNTGARSTAATLVEAGELSPEQGQDVLVITDRIRSLLDAAADGDETGLDLAIELVTELNRSLIDMEDDR